MIKFLANENFPGPSITVLRNYNVDILSIAEESPGLTDEEVMAIAINEERTIVTHDSDYGELIYRLGYKPKAGVVYFRINNFSPSQPGSILLDLIKSNADFEQSLTVINDNTIRQRSF